MLKASINISAMIETITHKQESAQEIDAWVAREIKFAKVRREIVLKLDEADIDSVEIAINPETNETLNIDRSGRFKTGFYIPATGENHLDIFDTSDPIGDFAKLTNEHLLRFNNDPRNSTVESWFAGRALIGTFINHWRDELADKLIQRLDEVSFQLAHQEELFPFNEHIHNQ